MQFETQKALATKLAEDTTLTSWLAAGINSMYAEGDVTPEKPVPLLIFEFVGSKVLTNTHTAIRETWIIRLYNRDGGYYKIEEMLARIFAKLNDASLSVPTSSNTVPLQKGVRFIGMTPRGYDTQFKSEYEGIIFDVMTFDRKSGV